VEAGLGTLQQRHAVAHAFRRRGQVLLAHGREGMALREGSGGVVGAHFRIRSELSARTA
jgi:hypothetical protein